MKITFINSAKLLEYLTKILTKTLRLYNARYARLETRVQQLV